MTRSAKTILLWLVLIVMFVAFYRVFSVPPDGSAVTRTKPPTDWGAVAAQWVPIIVLLGVVFAFLTYRQRKHAPTYQGVRLLGQGRYVQALEVFEKYRKSQPSQPAAAFNMGSTRLMLWKLEAALLDFQAAKKLGTPGDLATLLPEHLALTHALLGHLGEAKAAIDALPAGKGDAGRLRLAEAIILARSGDAAGARAKLATFEVKQLAGTLGAFARTLDAFCIERLTGELRHLDRIALFGETGPEELRRAWPELITFVERAPAW
jgi:tetratricopeptide (TPR) repeat protein